MKKLYIYESPEKYAEEINTDSKVSELTLSSMLETLLREMDQDGHDVSGPMTELVALKNYVTHTEKQKETVRTGLEFALSALKK